MSHEPWTQRWLYIATPLIRHAKHHNPTGDSSSLMPLLVSTFFTCADTSSIAALNCAIRSFRLLRVVCKQNRKWVTWRSRQLKNIVEEQPEHMTFPLDKMYTCGTWSHTNRGTMYPACTFSTLRMSYELGCESFTFVQLVLYEEPTSRLSSSTISVDFFDVASSFCAPSSRDLVIWHHTGVEECHAMFVIQTQYVQAHRAFWRMPLPKLFQDTSYLSMSTLEFRRKIPWVQAHSLSHRRPSHRERNQPQSHPHLLLACSSISKWSVHVLPATLGHQGTWWWWWCPLRFSTETRA
jgi:hypothetical protein